MENALYGIRPVCVGMILAIIFPLGQTNYLYHDAVSWPIILTGVISAVLLLKFKLSISKVICVAAALGLLFVR